MVDEPPSFNAYHRWLGISPKDQPPHHYRLLAIDLFESDPEVLRDAAEQRMAHVRRYQLGRHQALSQQILNELAAAKACLSDAVRKAAYDQELRERLASVAIAAPQDYPLATESPPAPPFPTPHVKPPPQVIADPPALSSPLAAEAGSLRGLIHKRKVLKWVGVAVIGAALAWLFLAIAWPGGHSNPPGMMAQNLDVESTSSANVQMPIAPVAPPPISPPPTLTPPILPRIEDQVMRQQEKSVTITVTKPAPPPQKEIAIDLGGGIRLDMVLIPAGSFNMGDPYGSPAEKPAHKVKITRPFYLGKYEVTQEQWQALMGNNPSQFKGATNPVDSVSWGDCQEFLERLNEKFAQASGAFRLPTEAEWEYACRAGSTTRYGFGDDEGLLGDYAWYSANSQNKTHLVGQKKPNAWGLYDMHGNVWEWCADWYQREYFAASPADDPKGPDSGADRVLRGGSWNYWPGLTRSADRDWGTPGDCVSNYGFRAARTP